MEGPYIVREIVDDSSGNRRQELENVLNSHHNDGYDLVSIEFIGGVGHMVVFRKAQEGKKPGRIRLG